MPRSLEYQLLLCIKISIDDQDMQKGVFAKKKKMLFLLFLNRVVLQNSNNVGSVLI